MKTNETGLRRMACMALGLLGLLAAGAAGATEAVDVQAVPATASEPLRVLAARFPKLGVVRKEVENHRLPVPTNLTKQATGADSVVQSRLPELKVATVNGTAFAGIGAADYGYAISAAPPDTTGAVGTTQYVQWVNTALAVFDKTGGQLLAGPVDGNTLFANLGGPCASTNDGDPLVLFDRRAQRWVLSQFAVPDGGPYFQCVAVSQTADATGAYWIYAFQQPDFNDYGKMGIWLNGYYIAYNMFDSSLNYAGARVCGMQRSKMLAGQTAKQVCRNLSTAHGGLLPADVDGDNQPAAGSPEYFVELDFGSMAALNVFRYQVDFTTPANSTLTSSTVPVSAFTLACGNGGNCVNQPGSAVKLDTLGDRLMYRLAWRKRAGIESLIVNHAVRVGTSRVGVRWYELRADAGGNVSVFQQSTFAPTGTGFRWMASMASDKQGNIAMGYSAGDGSTFPSIRYTARSRGAPLNTMPAEATLIEGTGSQKNGLVRWGDYSTMTVDPVDDCTFWYTTEYLQNNGSFNWHTHIASFKFPGCS